VNLLLVNHYAGSPRHGMEYRPYYMSREWVRAGHRVLVIAASFSHVRAVQPLSGDETIDGIAYRWLATPPYRGNATGRVLNIAAFLAQLRWRASDLARRFKPDAVIASSTYPMDIWPARRIARQAGAKLVYEVHDLWPASPIELGGMSPGHPFIRLCQKAENDAYRDADCVISMLPKVHDHMAAHGLDLSRLTVVPNGVSLDDWARAPDPLRSDVAQAIERLRASGRGVVGYAGSMGVPNALDTLFDAARMTTSAALGVVLVGDGHERQRLVQRITQETINNVTLLPPIPKAQIPAFLEAIDVAYIGWKRSPIYRFGIAPNKLMDYMMAGCVVLHSVEAGNDPVAESGCGLTVAPESAEAVAQGLRQLSAMTPIERRSMGRRGREFVLANHSYPVLARRFLDAVCR